MSSFRRRQMLAAGVSGGGGYITFADPVVEQICATNWGDGVGITPAQAAAVSSITGFARNQQIQTFGEMVYFTGLTFLNDQRFVGCTNLYRIGVPPVQLSIDMANDVPITEIDILDLPLYLSRTAGGEYGITNGTPNSGAHLYLNGVEVTSVTFPNGTTDIPRGCLYRHSYITQITLPSSIRNIGPGAFNRTGITGITLPEGLLSIGGSAFNGSPLTGVFTIPSTVTSLGNFIFDNVTTLTAVRVLATSVPSGVTNSIGRYQNWPIYVPYSADHSILASYKAAWANDAGRIFELNPDGTIPTT